jgi:transposase
VRIVDHARTGRARSHTRRWTGHGQRYAPRLDVHKQTISVAVLRPGGAEPDERTIANTPEALRLLIRRGRFEHPVASYEAGPTGYETHRVLGALGVPCDVVAPTMIPRRAGARVKTDPIDARNLARLHRAGELTAIRVPSPTDEAIRDLVRVGQDIKDDRRTTQHRSRASCCARDGAIRAGTRDGATSSLWARPQRFEEPAADAAYRHYLAALDVRRTQLATITSEIEDAAQLQPLVEPVAKLRCLRGIETLSAVSITAEVCDFRRFGGAPSFMAFTGLVPSEHSSGPIGAPRLHHQERATRTSVASSSRPPGATGTARRSGSTCPGGARVSLLRSWPTHGRHSVGSSAGSTPSPRRRTATSPSSRSRGSSRGSSGVS